jgi:hypothetical protein
MSSDQMTTRAQSAPKGPARAQGAVAVIDPATGQLREPTAQELNDLRGVSTQAVEPPTPIVTATGFEGLSLGDDQMTFTVAVKNADGTVSVQHAAGRQDAKRQVIAGANGGSTAAKERIVER